MLRIDRHWSMEIPKGWTEALREFSPISETVPWLSLRWFPMRRVRNGAVVDAGRWILHDCHHESQIDPTRTDILDLLRAERPSSIRDPLARKIRRLHVSDYQWEMYREYRVWAKEYWVIQGSHGGHPTQYRAHEVKWLQAMGLPQDPPALGALPYAPLDQRVFRELRQRDRLLKYGSLEALNRANRPDAIQREWDEAEKAFRQKHWAMQHEASAAQADFLDFYTRSSHTATDCRETIPAMSPEQLRATERAEETYVETGTVPLVA